MKASPKAYELIRHFEGYSHLPYICAGGKTTVGYGHVLRLGEKFDSVTEEEAEALLASDILEAEKAIHGGVTVPLTQNQHDALVSFVFNVGRAAFLRSTLRKVINQGWHDEAPAQFKRWVYAGKKRLPGLVARRAEEAALYAQKA